MLHMFVLIVLPFLAVYQEQSFEVQSEDEHLLPSDSRTCGLRRELDVFRRGQWGGGEVVITIHTSKNYHLYKRASCVGLKRNASCSALWGVSDAQNVEMSQCDYISF